MLKVLINAYACSPNMGSEPGMGWNWVVSIAEHCEVYVITEGEFRECIERKISLWPQRERMHFFYNPVCDKVRHMCWNQGDWRFYWYYRKWQRKTAEIARQICKEENIDVLHQLNMIGFREPGYLADVSKEFNIPLVWGPIGGLKQFSIKYAQGWRMKFFQGMKNIINVIQLKYHPRVRKTLKQANVLISSIPDSYNAIKKHTGKESVIIPETGCIPFTLHEEYPNRFHDNTLNVIWVGKFDYRKRLDIAIKAIAGANNPAINLDIYGCGNEIQTREAERLIEKLNLNTQVRLMGSVSTEQIHKTMRSADLFLFTSVSEDTSTVVLEAISNHLPVLCFDTCGMSAVIDESVGKKISLSTPEQSVTDFATQLNYFFVHREELHTRSCNCTVKATSLSWKSKGEKLMHMYENIILS